VDVGTLHGYREAIRLLGSAKGPNEAAPSREEQRPVASRGRLDGPPAY
jgi:hypothetical protein